eukprot:gene30792-37201_t
MILILWILIWTVLMSLSSSVNDLTWADELVGSGEGQYPRVAVCVSGQVPRWQPKHLFNGLLLPNSKFNFYLFYNLQVPPNSATNVYSTDPHYSFDVSPMAHKDISEAATYIQSLYATMHHIHLASLSYSLPQGPAYWSEFFHNKPLDRIRDHAHIQTAILNMYAHQPKCISQILAYEEKHKYHFHYVINTREDAYFFKKLDLTHLIQQIYHPRSDPLYASFPHLTANRTTRCDIPFKGCLNFWGFNMRFYVLRRAVAIQYLAGRFAFYERLYGMNRTVKNPEKFEYVQAFSMGLRGCKVPVDRLPVTAVRHVVNYEFCFILLEYFQCIPEGFEHFVLDRTCPSVARKLRKKQANDSSQDAVQVTRNIQF